MRYTSDTLKYIAKNFFYVILFAAIPAVFFALSIDENATRSVLNNLLSGNPHDEFWNIFYTVSIFNFSSKKAVFSGISGIVVLIFCVAMLTAFLEKHMRIGKRTLNGLFSKVNDNLISTSWLIISFLFIYEVWALILSALWYFVTGVSNTIIAYILLGVVYFAMHFVLLYAMSLLYLWMPCLQITGFAAFDALTYSYHLLAPVQFKIVLVQTGVLLTCEGIIGATVLLLQGDLAGLVVASVLYTVMILVYCIRMMIVYFDRAQLDRADLKKYY
ncbi:MAG: hypothetical protein IKA72_00650 [Clostridia bacterium]|nr:hypothetical protein [Clostridia bacterium]